MGNDRHPSDLTEYSFCTAISLSARLN